jgi:hypothetical protein
MSNSLSKALSLAAILITFAAPAPAQTSRPSGPPDLILTGGRVYTADINNPTAEAIAIQGERILAVGTNDRIDALRGEGTRVIELDGKTVIPGLIDSHVHLLSLGYALQRLDFVGTTSLERIVEMTEAKADSTPAGQWILGRGWDQNDWEVKDFPTHAALSAAVPDRPVWLTRIDGHAAYANAAAMRLAGVTRDTPDPDGGRILRDAAGEPTGVFIDRAMELVEPHIPEPSDAQMREALDLAVAECLKHGLTSVHDAGVGPRELALYEKAIDEGAFDFRVYAMIHADYPDAIRENFLAGPLIGYGNHRLTIRAIKVVIDGALGSRGAALLADYSDDPGNRGLPVTKPETLRELTIQALLSGYQVACHAIGDAGNRMALDQFANAIEETGRTGGRLRVEHAQVVALEDIPRFAQLGVIPSMQATHATSDMYWAEERVGPERIKGAYAWRRFLDRGLRIANGSDFPVEGVNPLWGFYAAIARQDRAGWPEGGWMPDQRMTREEALRSWTLDAAFAAFEEEIKGSIEAGKLADLVVLDKNIMEIPPPEILETRVEMTMLGGKVVYQRAP